MTSGSGVARGRCVHCKVEISVPDHYAHGDHIKCGACGTKHKVVRGDRLRLVLADIGPMRDALAQNEQLTTRLEAELAHARGSFGIGANGFGIALIYALYQVGMRGEPIGKGLVDGDRRGRAAERRHARAAQLGVPRQAPPHHDAHARAGGGPRRRDAPARRIIRDATRV